MKVIVDIPEKTANFAEATLIQMSEDYEMERLKKAAQLCREDPVTLVAEDFIEEATEAMLAIAILAIGKKSQDVPKSV